MTRDLNPATRVPLTGLLQPSPHARPKVAHMSQTPDTDVEGLSVVFLGLSGMNISHFFRHEHEPSSLHTVFYVCRSHARHED